MKWTQNLKSKQTSPSRLCFINFTSLAEQKAPRSE